MNYSKCGQGVEQDENTSTPGGTAGPKPKTPEEMKEDPNEKLNPDTVKEMSADEEISKHSDSIHRMELSPEQAKGIWESVTKGATHKHTACVAKMNGKVKDPHAFCKYLGDKNGYKPE
jgi:hypothetical protein